MSHAGATLHGFAFGEHLEGPHRRSLGYRLLAPAEPAGWCAEVEALARRLQAAPYPDHWPPTELFCSVLLADGQRLVAAARYGLADHTPSQRRGGLELIGVVGPGSLGVPSALALYRWLRQRRAEADDLHVLGGRHSLTDLLSSAPPEPPATDPVPVLPIRLWQEGALLFAATAPSDPDHHLRLLEQGTSAAWQWLPLVGADFPLATYARRGPLVAWTPHLAGVAVKLDPSPADKPAPAAARRPLLAPGFGLLLLLLLAANLWAAWSLPSRLSPPPAPAPAAEPARSPPPAGAGSSAEDGRDQFAVALHDVLVKLGSFREWGSTQDQLLASYNRLAREQKDLRLKETNLKGKIAVGALHVLAQRSADRVEEAVRKALANKGYDPKLIKVAGEHVYEQLVADVKDGP